MHWKAPTLSFVSGAAIASVVALSTTSYAATVYSDVPSGHWAYNAVQWNAQYGIMTGPGGRPGFFNAAGFVNRAELATVMARHHEMLTEQLLDLRNEIENLEERIDDLEDGRSASSARSSARSSVSSRASSASSVSSWMSSWRSSSVPGNALNFSASLTPGQETTTVTSNGSGIGTFTLNGNTLTYNISVTGLTSAITGAHFHLGSLGQAGVVIQPITFNGSTATGTWTLTQSQIEDLQNMRIYVNVHTQTYPDGEVRGQIVGA